MYRDVTAGAIKHWGCTGGYWAVLRPMCIVLGGIRRGLRGTGGHWEALGAHCQVVDGTGKDIEGLQAAPGDTGGVLGGLPQHWGVGEWLYKARGGTGCVLRGSGMYWEATGGSLVSTWGEPGGC